MWGSLVCHLRCFKRNEQKEFYKKIIPLSIIEGGYGTSIEFEGMVYDMVSEILTNSNDFPELQGLRSYRVTESEITSMSLGGLLLGLGRGIRSN